MEFTIDDLLDELRDGVELFDTFDWGERTEEYIWLQRAHLILDATASGESLPDELLNYKPFEPETTDDLLYGQVTASDES